MMLLFDDLSLGVIDVEVRSRMMKKEGGGLLRKVLLIGRKRYLI
jgi:hypothetical protein